MPKTRRAKKSEYDEAKNFCDTPPPKTGNVCADLSREIEHAKKCVRPYKSWDSKWQAGII